MSDYIRIIDDDHAMRLIRALIWGFDACLGSRLDEDEYGRIFGWWCATSFDDYDPDTHVAFPFFVFEKIGAYDPKYHNRLNPEFAFRFLVQDFIEVSYLDYRDKGDDSSTAFHRAIARGIKVVSDSLR